MKIKLAYSLSLAASAFLFISSVTCIIFQPDLTYISILWGATLAGSTLLIALSALTKKHSNLASKNGVVLALDLFFILAIFLLIFTGTISPKFEIRTPLGIGATFGYRLILSALVLAASIVATKDTINLFYDSSSKSREALVFLTIRLTAVFSRPYPGRYTIYYNIQRHMGSELGVPDRASEEAGNRGRHKYGNHRFLMDGPGSHDFFCTPGHRSSNLSY